jgi:hypothetical protein
MMLSLAKVLRADFSGFRIGIKYYRSKSLIPSYIGLKFGGFFDDVSSIKLQYDTLATMRFKFNCKDVLVEQLCVLQCKGD